MTQYDNRRHGPRLNHVFSVYMTGAWGSTFGIARNISEGGMFIEAIEPYPLGGRMLITFSLPGSDVEMSAVAEVTHICFINRPGRRGEQETMGAMGVRFLGFVQSMDVDRPLVPATVQ